LIDMLKVGETGAGGTKMNIIALHNMLAERGVEIVDETKLEAVSEKGIIVRGSTGEKREMTCDTVVLSLGVRAKTDAARAFADCANEVILVGDCNTKRYTIFNAITSAHDAAMSIL
jgi:NADH dehydrogenase FAD-containing subunit